MATVRAEDREQGVRVLTLDRPPANAITPELLNNLTANLNSALSDETVRARVKQFRAQQTKAVEEIQL